ncbi:unnamed protein product, partial [Mesorhabditis spiculigera]
MPNQFEAAERIARRRGLTRDDIEALGVRSQALGQAGLGGRAFRPRGSRTFGAPGRQGRKPHGRDEARQSAIRACAIRRPESLARLKPVLEGGIHTAGTSSQISDGAAAVLLMDEDKARALGLKPRARIIAQALATSRVLEKSGMKIGDLGSVRDQRSIRHGLSTDHHRTARTSKRRNGSTALITMCAGGALATGTIIERI